MKKFIFIFFLFISTFKTFASSNINKEVKTSQSCYVNPIISLSFLEDNLLNEYQDSNESFWIASNTILQYQPHINISLKEHTVESIKLNKTSYCSFSKKIHIILTHHHKLFMDDRITLSKYHCVNEKINNREKFFQESFKLILKNNQSYLDTILNGLAKDIKQNPYLSTTINNKEYNKKIKDIANKYFQLYLDKINNDLSVLNKIYIRDLDKLLNYCPNEKKSFLIDLSNKSQ